MDITEDDFKHLSVKEQNVVLFHNTNAIIRGQAENRFRLRLLSWVVGVSGAALVFLAKIVIEHIGHNGG